MFLSNPNVIIQNSLLIKAKNIRRPLTHFYTLRKNKYGWESDKK